MRSSVELKKLKLTGWGSCIYTLETDPRNDWPIMHVFLTNQGAALEHCLHQLQLGKRDLARRADNFNCVHTTQ